MKSTNIFYSNTTKYVQNLNLLLADEIISGIEILANDLLRTWKNDQKLFICGNGGSAANAIHIANDLHYGISQGIKGNDSTGIDVEALPANTAIMTCLANDTGYENVFSNQIKTKGREGDCLLVLSGSGNSPNVIRALEVANALNLSTHAILAYDGGICKKKAMNSIHLKINDMQVAEDSQLIIGHICMQWLCSNNPQIG